VTRAVQSAIAQTYVPMEIIVVIDGKDDATVAALDRIEHRRVRVVPLGESVGAAEARNTGVRQATGQWIAFLDDDDEWLPQKIEKQMRIACSSGLAWPIVSCRLLVRTPAKEYVWPRRIPCPGEPVSEYILARRGLFQGEGVVSTITLLTRRELLLQVPLGERQRRHQEWDWIFRALTIAGAQLIFVDEPLAIWNLDESQPSISATNGWRDSYEWIERVRLLITPRAYAAFLLTVATSIAARSGERRGCLVLLKEAIKKGRPAAIDLLLFLGMVTVPQQYRRRLRALFSS
jgi:glycosyltransferase involved in cell wall biosynthesis